MSLIDNLLMDEVSLDIFKYLCNIHKWNTLSIEDQTVKHNNRYANSDKYDFFNFLKPNKSQSKNLKSRISQAILKMKPS
jgi:hypothetical protein